MANQLDYVVSRMTRYLAAVDSIFQNNPPPANNAANGWIRGHMIAPHMAAYGQAPSIKLEGRASSLFHCFIVFHGGTHQAFLACDNHYGSLEDIPVLIDHLGIISLGLQVVGDILAVINADDNSKDRASRELAEDIRALVNALQAKDVTSKGHHANGWIATYVRSAANQTLGLLNQYFADNTTSDANYVAALFKRMCSNLLELPKDGHSPWLSPNWQLRYHAIIKTGLEGLRLNRDLD